MHWSPTEYPVSSMLAMNDSMLVTLDAAFASRVQPYLLTKDDIPICAKFVIYFNVEMKCINV